jgi:hypothetical protein
MSSKDLGLSALKTQRLLLAFSFVKDAKVQSLLLIRPSSPGSHERADCRLARGVDTEGGSALNTRDGAVENDGATIIQ